MLPKKKEDRIKSAQSNSPYSKKSKEGTSVGISNDGKLNRLNIWPEWSEAEINVEKWEVTTKSKEKDKSKSPQISQNFFDDPDGRLVLPPSLRATKWKRACEHFNKNLVVVDSEIGIHKFDIFTPNEHLLSSETMRWIICEINILWITSEKSVFMESESIIQENNFIGSDGKYHTWKFWEHIYAMNKVGKGFPQYNPAGKYIVKLFWMGEWRKIMVDDTLPFDENDNLLLPITNLKNELWPVILSKALLKIASLSYNHITNDTEFGDFSVIHSLTGWIPQKKIVNKQHQSQIWNDLQRRLNHWNFPDENSNFKTTFKNDIATEIQNVESNTEKNESKESTNKDKLKKENKDSKLKDKKEKDKVKMEKVPEGKYLRENAEILLIASYTSRYSKLDMQTVSEMADHSEALRKIGISQLYSHPVLLSYYRDCPLIKSKSPEIVPLWKLIRPLVKPDVPKANDCILHDSINLVNSNTLNNEIKFIEIQSPFLNYKITANNLPISPIENIEEDLEEITDSRSDLYETNLNKDEKEMNKETETIKGLSPSNKNKQNLKNVKLPVNDIINEEESVKLLNLSENKSTKIDCQNNMAKSWIDLDTFLNCFQVIYVYHKTETYRYSESFSDLKSTNEKKEPIYLFTDNIDDTEIIFCFSSFCKWFKINDNLYTSEHPINSHSPSINVTKEASTLEVTCSEYDYDNFATESLRGLFIAETHSWKYYRVGKLFKRANTNGTKAISLKLPAGRNCLRIFMQSPLGFHCKLISQNCFHFGYEDKIIVLSTEQPKKIQKLATDIINSFNKIITNFSNIEYRNKCEKSFFNLIMGFNQIRKSTKTYPTSNFSQVFNQCLVKILSTINKDIITSDMIFALRAINLDFLSPEIIISAANKVSSHRNSAKPANNPLKSDNRKQSSSKTSNEFKDEKTIEPVKEYTSSNLVHIIRLQKFFRGIYVRSVINARNIESNDHRRVVNELNKISNLIEQNAAEIEISILNELINKYPQIIKYYQFENDKLNHICLKEYSGNTNLQSGNGFGIIFREIFHINPSTRNSEGFLIKLNTNIQKCVLTVINNDNGETVSEHILKRLFLTETKSNNNGYTLMATTKDMENTVDWKLKLICNGNDILPTFSKQELCSDFSTLKIRDYYIPDKNGILFRQMIKVKNDHPTSIYIRLSNPVVSIRLSIFNCEEEVYFTEGIGEAFIPCFIFFKDCLMDDQLENINRSFSRNSNKSKKLKDKSDKYSAKNSRTNSSCSTEESKINKYSIEAFVNNEKWTLSLSNKEFLEKLKKMNLKDNNDAKIWTESPNKILQNSELPKKEISQKGISKLKGKEKSVETSKSVRTNEKIGIKNTVNENNISRSNSSQFDSDKANWTLLIISDASLEDNIQICRNTEKYEHLCAAKKIWLEMDSRRFEKGKQAQMNYNEMIMVSSAVEPEKKVDMNIPITPYIDLSKYYLIESDCSKSNYEELKCSNVQLYRKQKSDWNFWCQNENVTRINNVKEITENYFNYQKYVDAHRLKYYKVRERVKQIN